MIGWDGHMGLSELVMGHSIPNGTIGWDGHMILNLLAMGLHGIILYCPFNPNRME